jgi:hypothetical protein
MSVYIIHDGKNLEIILCNLGHMSFSIDIFYERVGNGSMGQRDEKGTTSFVESFTPRVFFLMTFQPQF